MGKREVYLHVGLPGAGAFVDTAVQRHRDRLAALGVLVPSKAREESFRAALEIRRRHREWGYKRKEVEGAWSGICRRALHGRSRVLVSQTALAGATPDQVDLLTSQLPGLKVHVLLTVAAPDGWSEPGDLDADLAPVLRSWSTTLRDPGRLHVVVMPRGESGRGAAWREIGQVVGFGTSSLAVEDLQPAAPLPARPVDPEGWEKLAERAGGWRAELLAGGYDVRGALDDLEPARPGLEIDPAGRLLDLGRALTETQHELERLSRRNETLEYRLAELEPGPRRLFRTA